MRRPPPTPPQALFIVDCEPHEDVEFVRTREYDKLSSGKFLTPYCAECRTFTHNLVSWMPSDAQELALIRQPKGKKRIIFLHVCDGCLQMMGDNAAAEIKWSIAHEFHVNVPLESIGYDYKH